VKYIFCIFFLTLVSCGLKKQTYLCGDHVCVDKEEFKEYFAKNLIIEVQTKTNKKNNSVDLVKLNTNVSPKDKKKKINDKENEKLNKINEKKKLKTEKIIIKEKRKIRQNEEKNKKKNEKKLAKLKNFNKKKNTDILSSVKRDKPITIKNKVIEILNDKNHESVDEITKTSEMPTENKTIKDININKNNLPNQEVSICREIKDCNIDKIAELLIKKGKEKSFPDITSK
jgi:hypothetical protein